MKAKILVLAAVGVGVGLLAAGAVKPDRMRAWCWHYFYRGKAGVERAVQSGPPPADPRAAAICRENLRRIENAKRKFAGDSGRAIGRLTWDDIRTEMPRGIPRCPVGGEYILGDIGAMPKCTIGAAGTGTQDDDHLVLNW